MVKTRHSFDAEDSPARFVSLKRICTRRSQNYESVPPFSSGDSDEEFVQEKTRRRSPKRASARRRVRCIEDDSAEEVNLESPELPMGPRSGRGGRIVNGDTYGVIRRSSRKRNPLYSTLNQSLIIDNAALGLVEDYKEPMPASSNTRTRSLRCYATRQKDKKCQEDGFSDMYSRVKRGRKNYKKDMYGIPIPDQGEETEVSEEGDGDNTREDGEDEENKDDDGEENDDDDTDDDSEHDDSEHDKLPPRRSYFLREHKPRTQIYEAPPIGPQLRRVLKAPAIFQDSSAPIQRKTRDHPMYRSPARRNSIRRKAAFHGSSSTSSDSSSSDDESRFQRRKTKSMAKARNRCLPMNLEVDDVAGLRKDRSRIGSSLADVDPMTVDRSITFESVGGLGKHVRALKEMVVFPLLYPEVFQKFKISPPRGVLFYGPPGTGKTLVARALANECSNDERRVAFFMRKGADCLSKWVGESERQLRLLFDQAYQMRPSIIFFDEIDGLAPVRSSRQDQIHSSIVSTLLALMDGLDSRGEIVIIGATNRIDSIDPALRRPGRFDREFLFPLPSVQARQQILKINTKAWTPKLVDPFLKELSEKCVGYCGADLKALCTEAALLALRRRYPQIYTSAEKLQLDVSTINVSAKDFCKAMQVIVPTAQRSVTSPARSLSKVVAPLLRVLFQDVISLLQTVFPSHLIEAAGVDTPAIEAGTDGNAVRQEEFGSDDDEDAPSIFNQISGKHSKKNNNSPQKNYFHFGLSSSKSPITHRPRLMLSGCSGQGQTSHLAPAVLHQLERLPVHILDLPALFACSAKSPEESCAQVFREARRTSPSIVYLPHIDQWWPVISDTLQATFLTLLKDLDPSSPILMFATTDTSYLSLDRTLQELFDNRFGEVVSMRNPSASERKEFFTDILLHQTIKPPTRRKQAALRALEVLPKAAPPEEKKLTPAEQNKMEEQEEATNRELRLFLRDALNKIARDRKFNIFAKPVDIEEVPDYLTIVKTPMDLSTMMSKIDLRLYQSVKEFLADINLICTNALEYNPDKDPGDRAIRHRACALRDTAQSIIKNELDPDFEKLCEEMAMSRKRRGVEPPKPVPAFYFTTPLLKPDDKNCAYPSRFSKRARGMEAEDLSQFSNKKRARKSDEHSEIEKDDDKTPAKSEESSAQPIPRSKMPVPREKNTSSVKKSVKKPKCIWNYTSRKRRRRIQQAIRIHRAQNQKIKNRESPVMTKATRESSPGSEEGEDEVTFSKTSPSHPAQDITESDISQDVVMDESIEADNKIDQCEPSVNMVNGTPKNTSITPPANSPHKHSNHKSPPAKRDLDFSDIKLLSTGPASSATVLDSGLGSSIESNCESMDSVDQLKQQTPQTVEPLVDTTPVASTTEKEATKESNSPKDNSIHETPPSKSKFHMTRSRSGNKDARHALEVLEEPEQPLVVDREKLERLLVDLVEHTHDYTVENLGKLYSMLSRCIFQHRKSYDKTQLLTDLESSIELYTLGDRRVTEVPSSSMVVPSTSRIYDHRTDI